MVAPLFEVLEFDGLAGELLCDGGDLGFKMLLV
jgi:hypothetical protein